MFIFMAVISKTQSFETRRSKLLRLLAQMPDSVSRSLSHVKDIRIKNRTMHRYLYKYSKINHNPRPVHMKSIETTLGKGLGTNVKENISQTTDKGTRSGRKEFE